MLPIQQFLPVSSFRDTKHNTEDWVGIGSVNTVDRILLTINSLFGFSALLMTLSTSLLIWLYGVVNGRQSASVGDFVKGQ